MDSDYTHFPVLLCQHPILVVAQVLICINNKTLEPEIGTNAEWSEIKEQATVIS